MLPAFLQGSALETSFAWIEKCQQAFQELKKFLESLPLLSKSKIEEILYLYLTTFSKAVSSVLIWLDNKGSQKPIYSTSQVLHDAETKYSKPEKIIYALIIHTQYLRPYFQTHLIVALIDQLLKTILQQPNTFGE